MGIFKRLFGGDNPRITITTVTIGDITAPPVAAPPTATLIKRTNCHTCGAAKTIPPRTAYVYCDFCGSLTDYDFRKACENPQSMMPGPAYEQLLRELQPETVRLRQTSDRDGYRAVQKRLFETWVSLCPGAVSPRAKNDAAYRTQLVDYMAETAVVNDFDPEFQRLAAEMANLTAGLRWQGQYPQMKADPTTFWPLYEVLERQIEHSYSLLRPAGVVAMHPDQAPEDLQRRMTWSMFCQGWLPFLTTEDGEKLVAEVGLAGEYVTAQPPAGDVRHCGVCGDDLVTLPGSKVRLCENCGTRVDVGSPEIQCGNCAGPISFPEGASRVTCPYCQSEAHRMAW